MMNERIRKLAEQADIDLSMTEFTGCLKGQDYLVTNGNLSEMQLEKFAELIVRECIGRIKRVGILEDIENETDMVADAVKEHFGVE